MSIKPIRNLFEYLGIIHRGRLSERADDHLQKAIAEVQNSQEDTASATITVTFKIQRIGDKLDMSANVESKLPKEKAFKPDVAWAVDGAISLQHPSQSDMFAGPREIRDRERTRTARED